MPSLKLYWESVPNAASYTVFWGTSPGVTTTTGIPISGITNVVFHHTDLLENTTYYYIVAAVDFAGVVGPPSIEFSAQTSVASSLAITPTNANIGVGISQAYTALVTYSDGYSQNVTLSTTWDTDNHSFATIDGSGLLTAVAVGTAQVQAQYLTVSASVPVIVSHTLVSIVVTPANLTLPALATQQYTAIGHYNDLTTSDLTSSVTWSSSNTAAATINSSGFASMIGGGMTTITATLGLISNSTSLTVTPVLQHLILSATVFTNLTSGISNSDVTLTTNSVSGFTSSGILLIDGEEIFYTGISGNTFTGLTRGYNSTTATSHSASAVVSQFVGTVNIVYPNTAQMTATGNYTDDSTNDVTNSVAWASDTPSVATIDSSGLITTHHHGSAIVTATIGTIYGPVSSTINIVVTNVLASITISPASVNLYFAGNTAAFTALGTYNDGDTADLTATVTWHSSNTGVATIASGGLLTAVASGSTNITATSGIITSNTAVATFTVWTTESSPGVSGDSVTSVWGYTDSSIIAGGSASGGLPVVWKWDGSTWTTALAVSPRSPANSSFSANNPVNGVKISPAGTKWFAKNIRNASYSTNNGSTWTEMTQPVSGQFINGLGIVDDSTLWVHCGNNSTNFFKKSIDGGSTWSTIFTFPDGNTTINDIIVFNLNDIVAVGNHSGVGVVWHYNGTSWTQTSPWTVNSGAGGSPMSDIYSGWGASSSSMYICGTTSFVSTPTKSAIVYSTDLFNTYTAQTFLGSTITSVHNISGATTYTPNTYYCSADDATSNFLVFAYQPGISTANQWTNAGAVNGAPGADQSVWVNSTTGRAVAVGGGTNQRIETNKAP